MTLVPRDTLLVRSALTPRDFLARLSREVTQANRAAVLFGGMRCEVDGERVQVGWRPWLPPLRLGATFDGHVSTDAEQSVLSGEVSFRPRWLRQYLAVILLSALVVPVGDGLQDGNLLSGLFGAVWLFGGGRAGLGLLFRAYRNRIERVVQAAAVPCPKTSPCAAP